MNETDVLGDLLRAGILMLLVSTTVAMFTLSVLLWVKVRGERRGE